MTPIAVPFVLQLLSTALYAIACLAAGISDANQLLQEPQPERQDVAQQETAEQSGADADESHRERPAAL